MKRPIEACVEERKINVEIFNIKDANIH